MSGPGEVVGHVPTGFTGPLEPVGHKKHNDPECWTGQGSQNDHCKLVDTHDDNLPARMIVYGS